MNFKYSSIRDTPSYFFDAIDFFKLGGRINRVRHFALFSFWLTMMIMFIIFLKRRFPGTLFETLGGIVALIAIINMVFLKIRRINDFGYSGWWLLLAWIPFVNIIAGILFFITPGTEGPNKFGQEQNNSNYLYAFMTLLLPGIIFFSLMTNYFGISVHFFKWDTFVSSSKYSVKLPPKYTVETGNLLNVPYTLVEGKYKTLLGVYFKVFTIDYSDIKRDNLSSLLYAMALKNSFTETLNQSNHKYMLSPLIINKETIPTVEIIDDKPITNSSVNGRFVWAKVKYDNDEYFIKTMTYVDEIRKKYYLLVAYYSHNSQYRIDAHMADYFLNSFKIG